MGLEHAGLDEASAVHPALANDLAALAGRAESSAPPLTPRCGTGTMFRMTPVYPLAARSSRRAALLLLAVAGFALLGGAGCGKDERLTPGVEVREPKGLWHTFIPAAFSVDPRSRPHHVSFERISSGSLSATTFSVSAVPYDSAAPRPPDATVTIFAAPSEAPSTWYQPISPATSKSPALQQQQIDGLVAWVSSSPLAIDESTFVLIVNGKYAFEFVLRTDDPMTYRDLMLWTVGRFGELRP